MCIRKIFRKFKIVEIPEEFYNLPLLVYGKVAWQCLVLPQAVDGGEVGGLQPGGGTGRGDVGHGRG